MAVVRKEAPGADQMELDAPNPRAVLGGNAPPPEEQIPVDFRMALIEEQADFYLKLDDLLGVGDPNAEDYKTGAVDRAKCDTEENFANCGVLINILRKAKQRVEKVHKNVKAPYLEGGRIVDQLRNSMVGRLDGAANKVEEMQKAYARAEQAKRDKEAADRLEEQRLLDQQRADLEALAKENGLEAALPPPPEPNEPGFLEGPPRKAEPIRTEGATISTGMEWIIDDVDVVKAIKFVKANTKVREAVTAAIKALVKSTENNAGKGYAGVTARQDVKISNR